MGEAFITRRGGEAVERTTAPSINFVSKTDTEIVVTFTNNDAAEAEVYYGITSTLTDTVTLAAAATSSNITFSGLDDDTAFTVSAYALVTDPTSKKIKSEIVTSTITTDELVITFTAATGGTTQEYDDGGTRFKSHTFTSDGTFTVTTVGDAAGDRNKVNYLIIAGGGGGGAEDGGGGGAGGYLTTLGATAGDVTPKTKVVVTAQGYSIVVGSGGAASVWPTTGAGSGTNSSAFGETATGGGRGGNEDNPGPATGGSGGGGRGAASNAGAAGTSGQGFAGGNGKARVAGVTQEAGGGGGGSSAIGGNATGDGIGGTGGNGLANLLRTGSNETRAGGGGGGGKFVGTGGTGGGANGGSNAVNPTAATANTGSGGGGAGGNAIRNGTAGAAGIVVIRYEIAPSV